MFNREDGCVVGLTLDNVANDTVAYGRQHEYEVARNPLTSEHKRDSGAVRRWGCAPSPIAKTTILNHNDTWWMIFFDGCYKAESPKKNGLTNNYFYSHLFQRCSQKWPIDYHIRVCPFLNEELRQHLRTTLIQGRAHGLHASTESVFPGLSQTGVL